MKNLKYGIKGLAIFLALGINTAAHAGDVAIAVKAGTLGLGIEATTNIVPLFANIRLQGNGFNYKTTITDTNVTYDAKLKLATVGLLADIYPFAGKFRITGGAYYNGNKLTMNARPLGAVVIGGTTYTNPTVSTTVDFNKFAPYAGIGWGDAISSGSPIGFSVELGAMYMGKPKTSIVAPGVSAADIAAEKTRLDNSLKNMQFYPVASIGVNFKF
ncbi:MAG: hypothetical protein COB41_01940 [Proteobacteria bacterium]|nr:MAG: hypothetical protein COB41_01940 [Pseudomonadota bacterium]